MIKSNIEVVRVNLVKIKVDTTSNKTADVTGMIIRKNNQYRIAYFPKLGLI